MKPMKTWMLLAHALALGAVLVGCGGDGSDAPYEAEGPDGTQTPKQGPVSGPEGETVDRGYQNAPSAPESGVEGQVDVVFPDDEAGDGDGPGDTDSGSDLEELCTGVTDACLVCLCEHANNPDPCFANNTCS